MIWRFIGRVVVCALVIGIMWASGFFWFMRQVPGATSTNTQHTDAIVVLTGGPGRLAHGVARAQEGFAPRVFVSGVENNVTATTLLRKHALPVGVQLAVGAEARNTIGNAQETAAWATREEINTLRLVTANYHMPRALVEFHFAMPERTIIPDAVVTTVPPRLLLSEYHKWLAAYVRHWLVRQLEAPEEPLAASDQ